MDRWPQGRTDLAGRVGDGAELEAARGREEVQGAVEAGGLARDDDAGLRWVEVCVYVYYEVCIVVGVD